MMGNEKHDAAHIRAMAAGLHDGMGGHADACAELMWKLAKAIAAYEQAQHSKTVTFEQLMDKLKAKKDGDAIGAAMDQAAADMALGRAMREAQQAEPVAWCWQFPDGAFYEVPHHDQEDCERDCAGYDGQPVPLYAAQPVVRDVLMAAMRAAVAECAEICDVYSSYKGARCASEIRHPIMNGKLADIADRYAAQPPAKQRAEPVAYRYRFRALKKGLPGYGNGAGAWNYKEGEPSRAGKWVDGVGYETEVELLYAAQPPAVAVAVPEGWPTDEMVIRGAETLHDLGVRFEENSSAICRDIAESVFIDMLAATQKGGA